MYALQDAYYSDVMQNGENWSGVALDWSTVLSTRLGGHGVFGVI